MLSCKKCGSDNTTILNYHVICYHCGQSTNLRLPPQRCITPEDIQAAKEAIMEDSKQPSNLRSIRASNLVFIPHGELEELKVLRRRVAELEELIDAHCKPCAGHYNLMNVLKYGKRVDYEGGK